MTQSLFPTGRQLRQDPRPLPDVRVEYLERRNDRSGGRRNRKAGWLQAELVYYFRRVRWVVHAHQLAAMGRRQSVWPANAAPLSAAALAMLPDMPE